MKHMINASLLSNSSSPWQHTSQRSQMIKLMLREYWFLGFYGFKVKKESMSWACFLEVFTWFQSSKVVFDLFLKLFVFFYWNSIVLCSCISWIMAGSSSNGDRALDVFSVQSSDNSGVFLVSKPFDGMGFGSWKRSITHI